MARITEKRLYAVDPQAFIANGSSDGSVQIADTFLFVVGQIVFVSSNTLPATAYKIKRITSATTLFLGPIDKPIHVRSDMSGYLLADAASIRAEEQPRPSVPEQEIERNTYAEEPAVARRVLLVDQYGNTYNNSNPLPISAVVDLDAFDSDPDSALAVGSEDGTPTGTRHVIKVASDGSVMSRNFSNLVPEPKTKIDILSRNANGDITLARFFNGVTQICDLQISYDINGDLLSVERV